MRVFYCDHYPLPLPSKHSFPIEKYALLREALLAQGILSPEQLLPAPLAPVDSILRVHEHDFVERFLGGRMSADEVRRMGFPWSQELVVRCRASVGGTLAAAFVALEDGFSGHLAGGTHHARTSEAAGYCVFNDIAVAAVALFDEGKAKRVLVFDVDVHQGDGTAQIFESDERVFTCSVHGARNFPRCKEASGLDYALPDDISDAEYLNVVATALQQAWDAARPDFVFVQGGVDPLATDRLGRLQISLQALAERDEMICRELHARGVPVVMTLGGGYSRPIEASIQANVNTYEAVCKYWHVHGVK